MSLARLPLHAVDASPQYLVALTGANIVVYCRESGALVGALDARIDAGLPGDAQVAAYPRLCALSPSETFLAVASDDKTLRVWRTEELAYGKEVVCQRLAKRTGTLQWTYYDLNGTLAEEVVLADKFGDVWSFPVDTSKPPEALPETAEEDPAEAAVKPRLGHVSMVTCLAFLGGPVPQHIVSADRDEHIRISRWGVRRAGHIVEQYLLGSHHFVGALQPLPDAGCLNGALLSADGGSTLRVWRKRDARYTLQATVTLDAPALQPFVRVDAHVERRRERAAGNAAQREPFDPTATATKRARDEEETERTPLVLTRIVSVADSRVLLTWEGATILALLPLDQLTTTTTLRDVYVYDVGAPIVSVAYVDVARTLYVATDDRPDFGEKPALQAFSVGATLTPAALPDGALQQLVAPPAENVPSDVPPLAKHAVLTAAAHTPRAYAPPATLSKLCLYPALTTWPKPPSIEEASYPSYFLGQRSEDVAKEMVQRFQSGKRAAGRAKNQAAIQQQFAS